MGNLKKTFHNMVDNLPEDKLLLVKENGNPTSPPNNH